MKKILLFIAVLIQLSAVQAADRFVTFKPVADALPLATATVSFSDQDYEAVKIAVANLQADFQRVGLSLTAGTSAEGTSILVGTLGKNPAIDRLGIDDLNIRIHGRLTSASCQHRCGKGSRRHNLNRGQQRLFHVPSPSSLTAVPESHSLQSAPRSESQ